MSFVICEYFGYREALQSHHCFSLLAVFSEVAKGGKEEEKHVEGGRKKLNKHIV